MKKLAFGFSVFILLAAFILNACITIKPYRDPYADPPLVNIEETYWYLDTKDNGLPWYYLYIKATNISKKSIKEIKWYCEFIPSGHNEDGVNYVTRGLVLPLEWPLDSNWQAGEQKIFRIPVQSGEDEYKDGIKLIIDTIKRSGVMPFWIKYTGLGGSWGQKDFDQLLVFLPIVAIDPELRAYIKYLVKIADFTILENSE
ncbi:MAG: hypothetical protein FWF37_01870 [Chloroflexi bacterium]|nr:hypothetical protein [Chloroflexota bacterium]